MRVGPCPQCGCPWAEVLLQLCSCASPLCSRYSEWLVDRLSAQQLSGLVRWVRERLQERTA